MPLESQETEQLLSQISFKSRRIGKWGSVKSEWDFWKRWEARRMIEEPEVNDGGRVAIFSSPAGAYWCRDISYPSKTKL